MGGRLPLYLRPRTHQRDLPPLVEIARQKEQPVVGDIRRKTDAGTYSGPVADHLHIAGLDAGRIGHQRQIESILGHHLGPQLLTFGQHGLDDLQPHAGLQIDEPGLHIAAVQRVVRGARCDGLAVRAIRVGVGRGRRGLANARRQEPIVAVLPKQ